MRADDFGVVNRGVQHVVPDRLAIDGACILVRQQAALAHIRPVFQLQRHAKAPDNGLRVNHGVGRSADGGVDTDGVVKRLTRECLGELQVFPHHIHHAHARHVGQHVAARVHCGNGDVMGPRGAQRGSRCRSPPAAPRRAWGCRESTLARPCWPWLRVSTAVGRRLDSPLENTGNSTGKPPVSEIPRFTCSAILRKWHCRA